MEGLGYTYLPKTEEKMRLYDIITQKTGKSLKKLAVWDQNGNNSNWSQFQGQFNSIENPAKSVCM